MTEYPESGLDNALRDQLKELVRRSNTGKEKTVSDPTRLDRDVLMSVFYDAIYGRAAGEGSGLGDNDLSKVPLDPSACTEAITILLAMKAIAEGDECLLLTKATKKES